MSKLKYLLLAVLWLPSSLKAQTVTYTYDASGNRTARTLSLTNPRQAPGSKAQDSVDPRFSVSPSPASSYITIRYTGDGDFTGSFSYSVESMYGETCLSGTSTTSSCTVTVAGLPTGYYILHIKYTSYEQNIKIIKK